MLYFESGVLYLHIAIGFYNNHNLIINCSTNNEYFIVLISAITSSCGIAAVGTGYA